MACLPDRPSCDGWSLKGNQGGRETLSLMFNTLSRSVCCGCWKTQFSIPNKVDSLFIMMSGVLIKWSDSLMQFSGCFVIRAVCYQLICLFCETCTALITLNIWTKLCLQHVWRKLTQQYKLPAKKTRNLPFIVLVVSSIHFLLINILQWSNASSRKLWWQILPKRIITVIHI